MKRAARAALPMLILAGCGGAEPVAAPTVTVTVTATPPPRPGPEAFIAYARRACLGSQSLTTGEDASLLRLGTSVCSGFDDDLGFARVSQGLRQSDAPDRGPG